MGENEVLDLGSEVGFGVARMSMVPPATWVRRASHLGNVEEAGGFEVEFPKEDPLRLADQGVGGVSMAMVRPTPPL